MIKSVELTNFTSYDHEIVEFEPVTYITGRNGHGKSNLLEALRITLFNENFPVSLIRNGQKEAVITVTFIDGRKIQRTRNTKGSAVAAWDADGSKVFSYTTVTGVTDQVQAFTGFRPVKLDVNGKAENLQYVPPKSPQFLLDRGPDVTMRCLSALLSGQGIEVAKTLINKDVAALDTDITYHQKRLTASQDTLNHLSRNIWEEFDNKLEELKTREEGLDVLKFRIQTLKRVQATPRIDTNLILEVRAGVKYFEETLLPTIKDLDIKTDNLYRLEEAKKSLRDINASIQANIGVRRDLLPEVEEAIAAVTITPCETCGKMILCGACNDN